MDKKYTMKKFYMSEDWLLINNIDDDKYYKGQIIGKSVFIKESDSHYFYDVYVFDNNSWVNLGSFAAKESGDTSPSLNAIYDYFKIYYEDNNCDMDY